MSLGCVGLGEYSLWGSRRRKQAESPSHWCLSITLVVQSHMIPQKKKIKTVYWPSGAICPPGSSSENWLGPFRCRFRGPLRHPKGRNGKELVPATRGDNRHLGVGTYSDRNPVCTWDAPPTWYCCFPSWKVSQVTFQEQGWWWGGVGPGEGTLLPWGLRVAPRRGMDFEHYIKT